MRKSIFFLVMFLFLACSNMTDNMGKLSVRVNIMSEYSKDVSFKVYLENNSGQAVNAAVVLVTNKNGITEILDFDNTMQCYTGTMNGIEEDVYEITVNSNLLDKPYIVSVPHTRLINKPVFSSISDSQGNNVLRGEALNKDKKIQISWIPLKEGVTYQVIVKNALNIKWMDSVSSSTVVIPENVLAKGSYYIFINAQESFGDIFYSTNNYYSVSNISSSTVSFSVE